MGKLKDFAKRNSPFIKLGDGESIEAVYNGYKESNYMGKETVVYILGTKQLSSTSGKLALLMDEINEGTTIRISRHGLGMDTTYSVKVKDVDGKYQLVGIKEPELTPSEETAWDDNV